MSYYFQNTSIPRIPMSLEDIFALEDPTERSTGPTNIFLVSLFKAEEAVSAEQIALQESTLRAVFDEIDLGENPEIVETSLQNIFATTQ